MSVDVTTEIEIARPRAEVASFASDPDNAVRARKGGSVAGAGGRVLHLRPVPRPLRGAVERARELLKRARTLKKLAARKLRKPARKLRRRLTRKLRTLVRQLNTLGPRLRMLRWRLGSERQLISRSSSWAGYRSLRAVDRAAEEAQAAYVAGSYSGAVVHFLSEESIAIGLHDGWAELAENLELERVPGDHFTLVREPHVQVLAERLTAQAEAVEAR